MKLEGDSIDLNYNSLYKNEQGTPILEKWHS
jgi:hypothetical protein